MTCCSNHHNRPYTTSGLTFGACKRPPPSTPTGPAVFARHRSRSSISCDDIPAKEAPPGLLLLVQPSSADASALRSFIPMAGLLPAPQREFLGAMRNLGEGGGEGGTSRDLVVILPPPLLPRCRRELGQGGQALVNDDDSITGACGGLGQTNAEQMPKEEGRAARTLPHTDTLRQRASAVA